MDGFNNRLDTLEGRLVWTIKFVRKKHQEGSLARQGGKCEESKET